MRQVFTLWPSDGPEKPEKLVAPDGFPAWARDPGPRIRPRRWHRRDTVLLACVVLSTTAFIYLARQELSVTGQAFGVLFLVLLVVVAAVYRRAIRNLETRLAETQKWNAILFHRSGVSLWREDWSAARDAVLRLLESGVTDVQSYFATRPDELRAIRRSVVIKDVNDHALERSAARSKDQLLGSLDGLLPDTDHTFVQWLIAFAEGAPYYRSDTHITMPDGRAVDTLFFAGLPKNMKDFEDILVSDIDITEYKATQTRLARAEADLARAARISTVGALTASIAHEVNSSLAAVVSSSEAALRWLSRETPELGEARGALQNTLSAATRAMTVVERTRAFLANAPAPVTRNDVATILQDSILLIDRELRSHGVSVHIDLPDGLPPVLADAVNIQQVVVNLMVNAAQAMSGQTGARDLSVSARAQGDRVLVTISDAGPGVPEDALQLIFQPFYSTRQGGMGMGLAICRSCIEANGGRITARAGENGGAVFQFDLPAAGSEDHPETAPRDAKV